VATIAQVSGRHWPGHHTLTYW